MPVYIQIYVFLFVISIKEQNRHRVKFSPYPNHRLFGSPGLLDSSEAKHLDLLPLRAPHFDSPCFLLLMRPRLKLLAPSQK